MEEVGFCLGPDAETSLLVLSQGVLRRSPAWTQILWGFNLAIIHDTQVGVYSW